MRRALEGQAPQDTMAWVAVLGLGGVSLEEGAQNIGVSGRGTLWEEGRGHSHLG